MKNILSFNRRTALRNDRGFTLIEIVVTLSVLVLVLAIIFQFFSFSNNMYRKTNEKASQQDQARLIVQGLRKDIGTALSIRIASSAEPWKLDVEEDGYYAVYVKDKMLRRKDYAKNEKIIYSSYRIQNLRVEFAPVTGDEGLSVVHVTIYVESTVINQTDIYLENTTLPIGATAGNLLTYKPS